MKLRKIRKSMFSNHRKTFKDVPPEHVPITRPAP
ncbi:stress response protein AzuC [Shigella flexneri]